MRDMNIKKKKALLLTIVCLSVFFIACSAEKYNEKDFIGKSSIEIVNEYGEFDCVTMSVCEDGLYKNCRCGYTIKEAKQGFLETKAFKREEIL